MANIKICLIVFLSFSLLFASGCKSSSNKGASSTTPVTDDEEDTSDPYAGTLHLNAYIGELSTKYTNHKLEGGITGDTSWATGCTVPNADLDSTDADIICLVEASELDIYYSGVRFKLIAPTDTCKYVKETPYYYFKYRPGNGGTGPFAWSSADPTCAYNYTEEAGPNCCTGEWTVAQGADPDTQPERSGDYGGDFSSCYSGPNLNDFGFSPSGIPYSFIHKDEGFGLSLERTAKGPLFSTVPFVSNVNVANYFNPDDFTTVSNMSSDHLLGGTHSPISYNFYTDANISRTYPAHPFYTYECLDEAHERVARIRIMVREWNQKSQIAQGGNPDTSGTFGTDPYNDLLDWLDFDTLFPEDLE